MYFKKIGFAYQTHTLENEIKLVIDVAAKECLEG